MKIFLNPFPPHCLQSPLISNSLYIPCFTLNLEKTISVPCKDWGDWESAVSKPGDFQIYEKTIGSFPVWRSAHTQKQYKWPPTLDSQGRLSKGCSKEIQKKASLGNHTSQTPTISNLALVFTAHQWRSLHRTTWEGNKWSWHRNGLSRKTRCIQCFIIRASVFQLTLQERAT